MARTEYYDDRDAPEPNSLVVAASAVVTDEEGRILLRLLYRRVVGGQLAISDDSTELRFVPEGELDKLPMHHTQRLRLHHFLEEREQPDLG
ncbi:hypothetical protein [Streptomyces melanosporofaciens]|uniref:NUDIX domain-containing protein n=1 Tax=Streptomyces melanosporofaciens TaxID=67327 RepID=A0A1H4QLG8_STRMJ|nr:hypothetical protein [Streptomyces melanosporofaciens]SEC20466.1 hypothetical protein SAMN04490356_3286 [Streptomyces melanosporofaciens]